MQTHGNHLFDVILIPHQPVRSTEEMPGPLALWHATVVRLCVPEGQFVSSGHVADGQNLWPAVHRHDSARVYRLALERGAQGDAYHAIGEEGVPFRMIAEAIGRQVNVPAKSLKSDEAEAHFGGLAMWVAGNGPADSAWTREVVRWTPREVGIIADIGRPGYSA